MWELLSDALTWKDWSGVRQSSLEREGHDAPNGVGSIRRLGYPPLGSREEIVLYDPPRRLGYVILSGMLPVKHYRSDVFLEETGDGGTLVTWKGSFDPLIPGTDRLIEALTRRVLERFARLAAGYAERELAAGAPRP